MRDWTATTIRADALTVPCHYCHAITGSECLNAEREPLTAFPAHEVRIRDAAKSATGAQEATR